MRHKKGSHVVILLCIGEKKVLWCLVLVVVLLIFSEYGAYETITKTKDCDHAFIKANGKRSNKSPTHSVALVIEQSPVCLLPLPMSAMVILVHQIILLLSHLKN